MVQLFKIRYTKQCHEKQGSEDGTRQCRRNKAVQAKQGSARQNKAVPDVTRRCKAKQGGARCNKSVPRETRQNKRSFRENNHERKGKLEKTK